PPLNNKVRFVVAMLTFMACAASLYGSGCGTSSSEYVRMNESLLREVPTFPGARMISRTSERYKQHSCFEGPPCGHSGFVTTETYVAPANTIPLEVVNFFVNNMDGDWASSVERPSAHGYVVEFTREKSAISVTVGSDITGESDQYYFVHAD